MKEASFHIFPTMLILQRINDCKTPLREWGMKYYIIAGEASGDLHGSNLIKELKKLDAFSNYPLLGWR